MTWGRKKQQSVDFIAFGLGNPGLQYAQTRHNTAWWVLDDVWRLGQAGKKEHRHQGHAEFCRLNGVSSVLVRPTTFYNGSGQCVFAWLKENPEARFVVLHDDFSMDTGKLRLRRGGRSGGNNGVQSIIDALGTDDFARLKVGVGPLPAGMDAADYVLTEAPPPDLKLLNAAVQTAARMTLKLAEDDWQGALDLLTIQGMGDKGG